MAVMPGIQFIGRHGPGNYAGPNPVGCILHRTENPTFAVSLQSFQTSPRFPHFLVGRQGEIAQIVNTRSRAVHVGNANAFYIGIEISSVTSRWKHQQDPRVIRDSPTLAQASALRRVVDWVSATHLIPKIGPPCLLGDSPPGLIKFKRMMGCSSVCAPNMLDSFGRLEPKDPVTSEVAWSDWRKKYPDTRIYGGQPNRISFYPADLARSGQYQSQADSWKAVQLFVSKSMPAGRYVRGPFLYTAFVRNSSPPIFPRDPKYRSHLVRV
jgi:hypothetical protein